MYYDLLNDSSFFRLLLEIDKDIAIRDQADGCTRCGGTLDRAYYQRKPRGLPQNLVEELSTRFSFCCRNEGCRKRHTPRSARFCGRRLWFAAVMLVLSGDACSQKTKAFCLSLGVKHRTLKRWRHWWQKIFAHSSFWRSERARLSPAPPQEKLPSGLLEQFSRHPDSPSKNLAECLRFLDPAWRFIHAI